jgi:hypothetical protein
MGIARQRGALNPSYELPAGLVVDDVRDDFHRISL